MKKTILALAAATAVVASAGSALAFTDSSTVVGVDHDRGNITLSNGMVLNAAASGFGIPADLAPGAKATVVYEDTAASQNEIDAVLFQG